MTSRKKASEDMGSARQVKVWAWVFQAEVLATTESPNGAKQSLRATEAY